jgi:hypothetical protein
MKNPWILPAATLVVGVVVGYISGINTGPDSESSGVGETALKTRGSSRGSLSSSSENPGKRGARKGTIESISKMPGNSGRVQALLDLYANLSPDQFESEAGKLEDLPMSERMLASFLLFGRWAETDPTAAMAFSNTMGFAGGFVRPTILQSWASTDPAGAAKYLASNPREFAMMGMGRGPMGGQNGTSIIASEWAKQDPAGALSWANGLSSDKDQALRAVVSEVAKTDPKKASEMLASMTGIEKGRAYRNVATEYGASNFSEAQAWVRTLPADEQAEAMASAIGGLSNKDPNEAARQLALMQAGEAKDRVLSEVVGDLARLDPKAASDLLKSQGSEQGVIDGVGELMPSWVSKDAAGALAFANSLDAGDARDSALQSYVWSNTTSAPSDLVRVAETIADEGDRQRTLGVAAARWMREDETAAKEYIQQSTTLSDDAKQRLIEGRGMWGGRGRGPGG